MTIGTLVAFAFAFPGTLSYATADLAPGRHVTVCLVFDGDDAGGADATPGTRRQRAGRHDPPDAGVEIGDRHYNLGMVHEFTVVGLTSNADPRVVAAW